METNLGLSVKGHVTIRDVTDKDNPIILVDKDNQINYENMSDAIALTLSDRGYGQIYQMAFGNGGATVDNTGVIIYLPPNTTGITASLYNQTYAKVVDDNSSFNLDPTRNKMAVFHTAGSVYSDILVQCLLDYGEPAGQAAFDNSTQTDGEYVFDELGLLANYGVEDNGTVITRLLTHVIFHPVQKSLNRQIQIDYTVRIQSLTNMITI